MSIDERIYPCEKCGLMRNKSEGGTTFTLCDKCWDEHFNTPKVETNIHSFARSQAIEFAEWMNIYNTHYEYFKMYNGWKHKDVGHQDGVYLPSSFLYDNFLAHQEKQKEGGII